MKYSAFICFFLCCLFLIACENEKFADCHVNGIWTGRWESENGVSGTFFSDVAQNETALDGYISIWFDLPSLENHGTYYNGRIENKEARVAIEISGVDIIARGTVSGDDHVSGIFEVGTYMSGDFQGAKLTVLNREAEEIYRFSSNHYREPGLLYVNNKLWLTGVSEDNILVIDTAGIPERTISGNFLDGPSAFDGINFRTYQYDQEEGGERMISYDTLGNKLASFPVPSYYVDAIAFHNNILYYADNFYRRIYQTDASLSGTDSIGINYYPINSFRFSGDQIVFPALGDLLFVMSPEGKLTEAYRFAEDEIRSIAVHEDTIWMLAAHYNYPDNGPSTIDCTVYRFRMEN
ncbi:MAG: hypothetical protein PVF73_04095 [Bacteroidales bacterium]|jgi:hypothetical protein